MATTTLEDCSAATSESFGPTGSALTQIHHQQLRLSHLLDRVAQTLTTDPGIFQSAVRHVVDAEARHIPGQQSADLQFFESLEHQFSVARENACLQPVSGIIDLPQRLVKIPIRFHGDDGTKHFLAVHFHFWFGSSEHGRLKHRTSPVAAAQQAGAAANRLLHPVSRANRVALANERPDIGGFIQRIARLQFFHARQEQVGEFPVDRPLHQDALHRNSRLPSVSETARHVSLGGVSQVSVAVHDDASIPAEFESNFLLSRIFLDLPAHCRAAGETDHLQAVIAYQQACVLIRQRQHVEAAIGPARLLDHLRHQQRRQGCLRRRLQYHGAARRDRRRDLMRHQVQRKITPRDARDRPQRKALYDPPAPRSKLLPVEWQILTVDTGAFFGGNGKSEDGALDLGPCRLNRLSGFLAQSARKFFLALRDTFRHATQHALAFESRQAARGAKRLDRRSDRRFRMLPSALVYASDDRAVVGRFHLDEVALFHPFSVHQETVGGDVCYGHLSHGFITPPAHPPRRPRL